jgi:hypothetical protein
VAYTAGRRRNSFRAHAAACSGRSTEDGHLAPSGQFAENQRSAAEKRSTEIVLPSRRCPTFRPSMKTRELTVESGRPVAASYASMTAIKGAMASLMLNRIIGYGAKVKGQE